MQVLFKNKKIKTAWYNNNSLKLCGPQQWSWIIIFKTSPPQYICGLIVKIDQLKIFIFIIQNLKFEHKHEITQTFAFLSFNKFIIIIHLV